MLIGTIGLEVSRELNIYRREEITEEDTRRAITYPKNANAKGT